MAILVLVLLTYLGTCAIGAFTRAGAERFRPDGPSRVCYFQEPPAVVSGAYTRAVAGSRGMRAMPDDRGRLYVDARPGRRILVGDCGLVMRFEFTAHGVGTMVVGTAGRKVAPAVLADAYAAFARAEDALRCRVLAGGLTAVPAARAIYGAASATTKRRFDSPSTPGRSIGP